MERQKVLIANWKMNGDFVSINKFFSNINLIEKVKIILAPSYLGMIPSVSLAKQKNIDVAAQNVSIFSLGNHTGSVSWLELKDYGVFTTFIGHPDVKKDFQEKTYSINQKLIKLLRNGIKAVLFLEESKTDLHKDSTKENLKLQLNQILKDITGLELLNNVYIVYMPSFVNQTGVKPTTEFIIDTIKILRSHLRSKYGYYVANNIPLLYGGNLITDDLEILAKNNDLDGILIDDERALSHKFVTMVFKHLTNGSNQSYIDHYNKNALIDLPSEEKRFNVINTKPDFDPYDVNSETYFKEIKIIEEDV